MLLIQLGSPDASDLDSVRRYMAQVFGDPAIVPLPRGLGWLRPVLGHVLATLRAPRRAEQYQKILTDRGAPLQTIIDQQIAALQARLPAGTQVFCARRYGRPSIRDTVRQIAAWGIEELTVVPMYPQYSTPTTWTAVREVYRQLRRQQFRIDLTMRSVWYDDAGYINAQARLIHEYAAAHELTPKNTHLLYSVHSLPAASAERGDPYADQIRRTADLVTQRLGYPPERTSLGYQEFPGCRRGLRPTTSEVLTNLLRAGERQVLVCPLSATTDDLDTLLEIAVRYRAEFETGDRRLFACPALNASEPFIAALRNLIVHGRHALRPREVQPGAQRHARLPTTPAPNGQINVDSLVMVGMSLPGRLGPGRGPRVTHADADQFQKIKRPRCAVSDILRAVCDGQTIREGLLWNTCRRFEFYGCLQGTPADLERAAAVSNVHQHLFDHKGQASPAPVNVLYGVDAWHYLMRTAAGLNSGLPGERDVLEQLRAAHRLAEGAGTAGPLVQQLLAEVSKEQRRLREQTQWGQYAPDHCYASISQIVRSAPLELADCRCVVIGGSTTSCGILDTLVEQFGVPRSDLTLLHRGHGQGGHLKMLRKAIGNGRRIRVNRYDERIALRAIADADVVFFGLDCSAPILDAEKIRDLRDFTVRPLTVFDFNLFGSTAGLQDVGGIRVWKAADLEAAATAYADEICGSEQFAQAVRAAESWICDHLPTPSGGRCRVSETR